MIPLPIGCEREISQFTTSDDWRMAAQYALEVDFPIRGVTWNAPPGGIDRETAAVIRHGILHPASGEYKPEATTTSSSVPFTLEDEAFQSHGPSESESAPESP